MISLTSTTSLIPTMNHLPTMKNQYIMSLLLTMKSHVDFSQKDQDSVIRYSVDFSQFMKLDYTKQ